MRTFIGLFRRARRYLRPDQVPTALADRRYAALVRDLASDAPATRRPE